MQQDKKVIILVPAISARGGITNYYQVLKEEFPESIEYMERGARTWPYRKGFFYELFRAFKDLQIFKKRLSKNDIALVQTTTSLGLNAIIRDGLFVRYANKKRIKAIVFFRGWDETAVRRVESRYFQIFKYLLGGADTFITLSEKAKKDLRKWGIRQDIYVESTVVDKNLLHDVNENAIAQKFSSKKKNICNLLFVSRVEKAKGIYELLQAYKILQNDTKLKHELHLTICGDGFELENMNKWVASEKLNNVEIKGFVSGLEKKTAFENAHIFVFPSFSEGMPNAVLEAMGFGLPVITTAVGGLVDFFVHGQNGYFIEARSVTDVVDKIRALLNDQGMMLTMGLNNYTMAKKQFRSDKVARRMESIFTQVIGD